MQLRAPQVAVDHHRLLARAREQARQVHDRGGLALLGRRAGHQHHLPALVAAREDERRPQVLVGLGRERVVLLLVARHGGQQVEVQVALDLLRVADRVRELVAHQHQAEPGHEPEQQARERDAGASAGAPGTAAGSRGRRPRRCCCGSRPRCRSRSASAAAPRRGSSASRLPSGAPRARSVLRLWFAACAFSESMAFRSSVSRFLSCVYSASSPSRICAARASLRLPELLDLRLDLLHLGVALAVLLAEPAELDREARELGVEAGHDRVGGDLRQRVELLAARRASRSPA